MNNWKSQILSESFDLTYIYFPVENKPHTLHQFKLEIKYKMFLVLPAVPFQISDTNQK